ncbi:MAG: hypothetical protein ACYC3X_20705 [Pirellulaceae bacterium]
MRHTTTMKQVMTSPHFQFSALTVLLWCLSAGNVFSAEPAIPGYTPAILNCTWSHRCIGMATVTKIGDRLAMLYDAAGGESIDHLGRDIGLAWYDLPLVPPLNNSVR